MKALDRKTESKVSKSSKRRNTAEKEINSDALIAQQIKSEQQMGISWDIGCTNDIQTKVESIVLNIKMTMLKRF